MIDSYPDVPARLAPFLAQWDYVVEQLFARLEGLTDEELTWEPAPDAEPPGILAEEIGMVGRSASPGGLDPQLPLLDIVWWVDKELLWHAAQFWYGCVWRNCLNFELGRG